MMYVANITYASDKAMSYLNNLKDEVVLAAETHLNKEASRKIVAECRKHDRNAAASPAIANLEDTEGYSGGMFVSTLKHVNNMFIDVGSTGSAPTQGSSPRPPCVLRRVSSWQVATSMWAWGSEMRVPTSS